MPDLPAQGRKKLERANLPGAASQEKDAPHGVCIHTAEGDLEGNIVLYDTEYLELAEAELAALAVNALAPLVEALEGLVEAVGMAEGREDVSQWAIHQIAKNALADLQEQLQKEQAGA